ncbi:hypothetical protein M0R04_06165 [Candidatus Dojkabacteria bacterium]|jgi:hypothetical protein|nr:hypothetical protein [Candidatus Dojkabacteria bacterium]
MTEQPYVTRDLYLAATLLTLKFKVLEISFQYEGIKAYPIGYFAFKETPELREVESLYLQGKLAVEPREFMSNVRELKTRVANVSKSPYEQPKI